MSILDRKRELEWGEKNRARDNTLIVYKATPEEIEKLKGASDMGRPAGSKNKKNHSGIEIVPNDKKSVKPLNQRREELAKKLEVDKEEEKHEMNETHFVPPLNESCGQVIETTTQNVEANIITDADEAHELPTRMIINANPGIDFKTIASLEGAGPVIDNVKVNEYHRTLINKIRKAAYEAYVEEIASLYTGMDAENLTEKISNIIDISATTLMEMKERGL